jgi:hypothetical protein
MDKYVSCCWNSIRAVAMPFLDYFGLYRVSPATKREKPPTLIAQYVARRTSEFIRRYESDCAADTCNSNIDPIFYDRPRLKEAMKTSSNYLETEWRTRILLEYTPRGSVIMYYDAFKEGFAYYSDQYMTYDVLCAVASKYVLIYKCRDFFLDMSITPKGFTSPFVGFYQDEVKEEIAKKRTALKRLAEANESVDLLPIAKLKNYSLQSENPNAVKKHTVVAPPSVMKTAAGTPAVNSLKRAAEALLESDIMKNKFLFSAE